MSVVAFLQELLDAGLPLEAAMTAARIHEEQFMSARPAPSAGAERTRRWRERRASQGVTERHEASHVTEGDVPSLPLPPSPQTPLPPTPTHPDITPRARKGGGSVDFDAFWRAYPRKVAKDAAIKAFAKAVRRITDPDPLAVILAGIERALPGWDDPQFIPHPSTWLNRGSWEDEAPTPATTRPERPANDRPDRFTAKQSNYDAAFAGADWADQVLAARRAF